MFGQVLDKLDNYFGRSFLIARYFPWMLAVAANLAIASIECPAMRAFLVGEYQGLVANKLLDLALAMLVIWVVAYATAPLVQSVIQILEGSWIGEGAALLFIAAQADRREVLEHKYRAARQLRDHVPDLAQVKERWKDDREIGAQLVAISSTRAIEEAEKRVGKLRTQRWLNKAAVIENFNEADEALSAALRANCAEVGLLRDPQQAQWAGRLDDLHKEMTRALAPYVLEISSQVEYRAQLLRDREFAKSELAPTRLGNDAAALRSYCETRYGISFDLFWPRFLLLIEKDDKIANALATASMQLDFSILTWSLTVLSTVIWGLLILFTGRSLLTFIIIYLLGPLAIALWLYVIHESYGAFADVARGAIDLNRFIVLDALRRPLPVSTDAERKVWEDFARLAALNEHEPNVTFRHPAKT